MNNKITEKYLKSALKHCPFVFKKRLRADLYNSLCDYLEENPKASETELAIRFGSPKQYWEEYLAGLENGERAKFLSKNKVIKSALVIGIALVVLLVTVGVGAIVYDVYNSENYFYRVNVEEI